MILAYLSTSYCVQLVCRKKKNYMLKKISTRKTLASMPFFSRKKCIPQTQVGFLLKQKPYARPSELLRPGQPGCKQLRLTPG